MHINPTTARSSNRSKVKPIFAKAHSCATRRHKYMKGIFEKPRRQEDHFEQIRASEF
jgi:hypothetical protein